MNRPDRETLATERLKILEPELPFLTLNVPASIRIRGMEITRNGIPITGRRVGHRASGRSGRRRDHRARPRLQAEDAAHHRGGQAARGHHGRTAGARADREAAPALLDWPAKRGRHSDGRRRRVGGGCDALRHPGAAPEARQRLPVPELLWPDTLPAGRRDDNSKANVSAWISDGFIALAVAGLGIGSYFFFTGGQEHAATPTTGKGGNWNWVVGATPKSASGSLTYSF